MNEEQEKVCDIAWCCINHDMSGEQTKGVRELLNCTNLSIIHDRGVWSETADEGHDALVNRERWRELLSNNDAVFGIFPPSAFASYYDVIGEFAEAGCMDYASVYVPISKMVEVHTPRGVKKMMQFIRWQQI